MPSSQNRWPARIASMSTYFDSVLGVQGNCFFDSCNQSKAHLIELGAKLHRHVIVWLVVRIWVCRTCKRDVVAKGCFIVEELSIPCHIKFDSLPAWPARAVATFFPMRSLILVTRV